MQIHDAVYVNAINIVVQLYHICMHLKGCITQNAFNALQTVNRRYLRSETDCLVYGSD